MRRDTLLVILTFAGSVLLWWPMIMVISLDIPWWLPLPLIVMGSGLATALFAQRWLHFAVAAGAGTFVGIYSGFVIWKPADGVATAYSGLFIAVATSAALILSLIACYAMRKSTLSDAKHRQIVWIVLLSCLAAGPVSVALTPPLIKYRVARDDRAAVIRLEALNTAAEKAIVEVGDPKHICDGNALQRSYSGPMFSDDDWGYITANYVRREGYVFSFSCEEKGGYVIEAWPARGAVDGTRRLCADEAHKVGCDIVSNGSRRVCKPCGLQ